MDFLQILHKRWYRGWTSGLGLQMGKCFLLHIFRTNGWILIKLCVYIDIYKIHVVTNTHYFQLIFNSYGSWSMLEFLFMRNILWIKLWISINFCICIDIDKMYILDDYTIVFVNFQPLQISSLIFNRVMAIDWCEFPPIRHYADTCNNKNKSSGGVSCNAVLFFLSCTGALNFP